MKITFISLVLCCYFMMPFSSALATVAENNIDPDTEKFVVNTSVQYLDNYHPRQSDGISVTALSA
jgi:hypothetical protein